MLSGFYAMLPTIPPPFRLLGDSGFQAGPQLLVTQSAASLIAIDPADAETAHDASSLVARVRILVEWCLGGIKGTFRRLMQKLPSDADFRADVISAAVRLWNLRVRRMGVSEVRTVFSGTEDLEELPHPPDELLNF
jgi:hypothetical protein